MYLDGATLNDNETLSSRGIKEGSLLYYIKGAGQTKPKPVPKKGGLGIADMIKKIDQ